jgi:hypothetical protein
MLDSAGIFELLVLLRSSLHYHLRSGVCNGGGAEEGMSYLKMLQHDPNLDSKEKQSNIRPIHSHSADDTKLSPAA